MVFLSVTRMPSMKLGLDIELVQQGAYLRAAAVYNNRVDAY